MKSEQGTTNKSATPGTTNKLINNIGQRATGIQEASAERKANINARAGAIRQASQERVDSIGQRATGIRQAFAQRKAALAKQAENLYNYAKKAVGL